MAESIQIEVVYAKPDRQEVIGLKLPEGATIKQAVEASGLLQRHPELDLAKLKVGIFGKVKPLDTVLAEGDRVEIYFPVTVDPKTLPKRKPAAEKKTPAPGEAPSAGANLVAGTIEASEAPPAA